jgi:type VI secretion system VasD/TssJ family lipoprotein
MSKSWRVWRGFLPWCVPALFLLAAGCVGCGKKIRLIGPPGPIRIDMMVRALPELNEGNSRQGNPVVFCVYQLQNDVKFREATSENFWREGEKILEKDLLAPKFETTLYPNQTQVLNLKVVPETKFLGLAANFHTPDAQRWHLAVPLSTARNKNFIIEAGKDFLNITNR